MRKLKKKDQIDLLIVLVMIGFLLFMTILRREITTTAQPSIPSGPTLEENGSPNIQDDFLSFEGIDDFVALFNDETENDEEIEYERKDIGGVFSFSYPSHWTPISTPSSMNTDKAQTLFFVSSGSFTNMSGISVIKLSSDNIADSLRIIKEEGDANDKPLSIEKIGGEEGSPLLKVQEADTSNPMVSFQKIICATDNCFLLALTFLDGSSDNFEKLKEDVFGSVKIKK